MTRARLPGEDRPLRMRYGGAPITDAEALGVARRLARLTDRPAPFALPTAGDRLVPVGYRLPGALLARVRARAEMEGRTVSEVITAALEGYASSSPGSEVVYVLDPAPALDNTPGEPLILSEPWPVEEPDPVPDPDPAFDVDVIPEPELEPALDPARFATAAEIASRLGVPRPRVLAWVRTARERGTELEGPRSVRRRSRTPVYDIEGVAAFGATMRLGRPRREPTTPLVARTGPRRQRPRHQHPPAAE